MKGLSITICFGKYGGFHAFINEEVGRLCLGWVAISIYWQTDLEELMKYLISCRNELKKSK